MSMRVNYKIPGNWSVDVCIGDDGKTADNDTLTLATLCVIRDELKRLNSLLHCVNFTSIPHKLDRIEKNTRRKRKKRVVGKPSLRVVGTR